MPLVDEQTQRTDRRPTSRRAWFLVVTGLALLWVVFSFIVSWYPQRLNNRGGTPTSAVQRINAQTVQQAQQLTQYGNWKDAAMLLSSIGPEDPMSVMDKHTYFSVAAESLTRSGKPLEGAGFYDRYLTMGTRIREKECGECHGPAIVPPGSLVDLERSELGTKYVNALRAAGKLRATRDTLAAQLKKKPDDPRLHVLLFHLERALKNDSAVQEHADRLQALSKAKP